MISFINYRKENDDLINTLLNIDNTNYKGFSIIKDDFQQNFIDKIKDIMPTINSQITGKVHDLFSELLNDTTEDSSTIDLSKFNLFSWMNCSAIGQDYNATLSTLKSNLTNEMRVITYCSLVCEFLLIANLYVMVGLAKNLRDKLFEINDERNVSHSSDNIEELQTNHIKATKKDKEDDEIFAIKNKKKFEIAENIDQKRGIDINEGLDKNGNRIIHPNVVSINGPDGRCIFENGENAHKELQNTNKNNNLEEEESEENNDINNNTLKIQDNKKVEIKNLPKKKKQIIDSDEESENDEDNENDEESENEESSSRKSKDTKSKKGLNKNNKTTNQIKSSKGIKLIDKKSESSASSSVSFGK